MANDPVADALAGAKKTLANAYKFTQSVEGQPVSQNFAPPVVKKPDIPQAHEHANAPYSLARQQRPGISDEARSAGEGIKARMEMEDAARKSLQ